MPGSVLQGVIFAHMIAESEEVIDDCPLLTAPGQVPYETCKEVPQPVVQSRRRPLLGPSPG